MHYLLKSYRFKRYLLLSMLLLCIFPPELPGDQTHLSKEETVLISNAVGFSAITAWGILNWDYFQNTPKKTDEGWFSDDTKSGGIDKLGHFYFSYSLSHIFSSLYENHGYSLEHGALLGSLSSFGMTTWMEIGDSFSSYGFSYEDFAMNLLGSIAGYFLYTHQALSEKIDFRIEYRPEFNKLDFVTDYENQKFLMALKFDGFDLTKTTFLKYFEFHLGYYTRGYSESHSRQRNVYAGIGLNLSRLFKQLSMPRVSKMTQYIQIPYTYVETRRDLNR